MERFSTSIMDIVDGNIVIEDNMDRLSDIFLCHCSDIHKLMDRLDGMTLKLLDEKVATDTQRSEFGRFCMEIDMIRSHRLNDPVLRIHEVIARSAKDQFSHMVKHYEGINDCIILQKTGWKKQRILLMKRWFVFLRVTSEIIEGFKNANKIQRDDLILLSKSSVEWTRLKAIVREIQPISKDECLEAYHQKMVQGMAILASIGRQAQLIPQTEIDMKVLINKYKDANEKIYACPIEFEFHIDYSARDTCDQISATFLARVASYMMSKEKCLIDGHFMIAQSHYGIFRKFFNMAEKKLVRIIRSSIEYPTIEHNVKFYLPIDIVDRFFINDHKSPVKLSVKDIVLSSEELLSHDLMQKRPDRIMVRFFFNKKIKHFSARLASLKADRNSKKTPVKETETFNTSFHDHIYPKKPSNLISQPPMATIRSSVQVTHTWLPDDQTPTFDTVLIYVHGGGFASMSSASHQNYLRLWANDLMMPIFSIDYRLAPMAQYPCQLNDVVRGYVWILGFIQDVLHVNPKKIILSGDSAGGNLCIGLTSWCIENGLRAPEYLITHYAACDLNMNRFTSSFVHSFSELLLNFSALRMCGVFYLPKWSDPINDYYISPVATPAYILNRFPPTYIFCCERDPLCDDSFRFAYKMREAGVPVEVYYFKSVSHGQLNFAIDNFNGLPQAVIYEKNARDLLKSIILK